MNKVSRTLIIFTSNLCLVAFINNSGAVADNSNSTSPVPSKTILKGAAEDAEKMQKSIKLMVPDPSTPSYLPETHQPGVSQSELYRQSVELQKRQSEFREQAAAARAAALLRQQAEVEHQAAIQRHFGLETQASSTPFRFPLQMPRAAVPNVFSSPQVNNNYRRSEDTQIQVNPWTDVVATPYRQKKLAELQTAIKQLHSAHPLTPNTVATGQLEPPVEKRVEAMKAVEMMLPMTPAPKDWDAWYKRVASAIYDRWRQNTAGPGTSVVLITVYDSRDVDCRVTNFTEAAGAERNGAEESRFKQVSLQCIDGLSGDEIWQFPAVKPLPKKIVFDMEFKHVVGENSGCRIVHLHNDLSP